MLLSCCRPHVKPGVDWSEAALHNGDVSVEEVSDVRCVGRIIPILAVMPIFFMLLDQQGSSWILQAKSLDMMGLEPEQMSVVNPILVLIFLPLFDRVLYPGIRKCGCNFSPLRKMSLGMVLAAVGFLFSAGLQHIIDSSSPKSVPMYAQLPQIFIVTMAEILVSVTGLEFAYTQAPQSMKSLIASFWLVSTAIGDLLTGVLCKIYLHQKC